MHTPPMLDGFLDQSFDSPGAARVPRNGHFGPPVYIPPPPSHAPPRAPSPLNSPSYTPPRLDDSEDENDGAGPTLPSSHPPPPCHSFNQNNIPDRTGCSESHIRAYAGVSGAGAAMRQPPRNPFQPLQPNNTPSRIGGGSQRSQAKPKRKVAVVKLPSSAINKGELLQATTVFRKYPALLCESKIGTLATKLAREAFFGDDVLIKCTVVGERDYPGLPAEELHQLKHAIFMHFPQYWNSQQEFKPIWKKCTDSIGQACKRLRSNAKV